MSNFGVPLSEEQLSIFWLCHIRAQLATNFTDTLIRQQMTRQVADIILSLSPEQIQFLCRNTPHQGFLRTVNPSNVTYWLDLKRAVSNSDATAVNLSLLQGLMGGFHTVAAA